MAVMQIPAVIDRWLTGWAELVRHDAVPGYAGRSRCERLGLDLAAVAVGLASPGTWFAALIALATGIAALLLVWHFTLTGWQRDVLLCLPVVVITPWTASARRRHLARLLARRSVPTETVITDGAAAPGDSPVPATVGRDGPWQHRQARRMAAQGRASTPLRRWWRWLVSA